jgi:hypothetical protein
MYRRVVTVASRVVWQYMYCIKLARSKLAMPVEIVQFCHKYTLNRCVRE